MNSRTKNGNGWNIEYLPNTGGVVIVNEKPYPCKCKAVVAMNALEKPPEGDLRVYEALK